jgi:hypothetical protein
MIIGIDCYTEDVKNTARRIDKLSGVEVQWFREYGLCPECSMICIETTKSVENIEDWLYRTKGVKYIGAFEINHEKGEN